MAKTNKSGFVRKIRFKQRERLKNWLQTLQAMQPTK